MLYEVITQTLLLDFRGDVIGHVGGRGVITSYSIHYTKLYDVLDGALPRKTFSMGEADEKRFYLECRRIK